MKRRVIKVGDRRFRVELPGGDVSEFSYREKARHWDPYQGTHVDFEAEEDRYLLSWEGLFLDSFRKEEEALLFILRFGYSISDQHLIPSEILADFNLVYEAGDWVDEWRCSDRHEVVFALGKIQRPVGRKIQFQGYPRITPKKPKKRPIGFRLSGAEDEGETEVVTNVEIPKLDFEELEKPKERYRTIPRTWADLSDPGCESWMRWKLDRLRRLGQGPGPSDADCLFPLESGEAAVEAFEERKKSKSALPE